MASFSLSLLHPPFLLEEVTKGGGAKRDYDTGLLQSQSDRREEHMLQLHPLAAFLKKKKKKHHTTHTSQPLPFN